MKQRIIAGLLAGLFAGSVLAAGTYTTGKIGDWQIVDNHLIHVAELTQALTSGSQDVAELARSSGRYEKALPSDVIQGQVNADGLMLGNELVKLYRERGYLTVEARVDPSTKTIRLVEAKGAPTGAYSAYVAAGTVLTRDDLELAAARMTPAAQLNGEKINIEILSVDSQTGNAEIRTSATPVGDAKRAGSTVGYSSMGQRYSGPDVATVYGWANIGNGQQLDASLAHGFSNWRSDSKHGRYESGAISYRRASQFGLISFQFAQTDYKTGGADFSPLGLNGTVSRVTIEHTYLLTKSLQAIGRVSYTANRQNFDLVQWTDKQHYTAGFAGLRYQGANWAADVGIEQGLGGSRQFNVTPLLGRFDSHYTAFAANASAKHDIGRGWTLTGKAGLQTGPDGTPNSAQFALGGPDRGRSYTTGYTATPTGAYLSASINAPVIHGIQAYAGIDGAKGKPVVGPDREAKSVFIGGRFFLANSISGDVGFAKTLGRNDDQTANKNKFTLTIAASF